MERPYKRAEKKAATSPIQPASLSPNITDKAPKTAVKFYNAAPHCKRQYDRIIASQAGLDMLQHYTIL